MDALGFSQRRGNGGKGIGVKCVYGEYLHLKKRFGLFWVGRGGFLHKLQSGAIGNSPLSKLNNPDCRVDFFFFSFFLFSCCLAWQQSPVMSTSYQQQQRLCTMYDSKYSK